MYVPECMREKGGLWLVHADCYIWNRWLMGSCCIAQGTVSSVLVKNLMENEKKEKRCLWVAGSLCCIVESEEHCTSTIF